MPHIQSIKRLLSNANEHSLKPHKHAPQCTFCGQSEMADLQEDIERLLNQPCSSIRDNQTRNRWGKKKPVAAPTTTQEDQQWLSPQHLETYADAVHQKGAALENCWDFVDGTVRPVCRPGEHQQVLYNGHERIHALKFQSLTVPSGMIAHLYGPAEEGRRYDAYILRESGLLAELEARPHDTGRNTLCIHGDPAYPLCPQLQVPFPTVNITDDQQTFNAAMSKVRITVEWSFGKIVNFFKFTDFKKTQKVRLSACARMYIVSGLLTNANTCLYGNTTSSYFELDPPSLEEYFENV